MLYFKLLLFLPNRILVKHLENHSFTLKVYYRPILQENTYLVQKIGHFSWLSKPSVHLRVVMVFIFSDFFLQTQPQGFPPPPSPPIREFRRNLMEIV